MPQRPASAELPGRTPWIANTVIGHHPEQATLQSLPQKRRALDTDYPHEALRSMKYEVLAAESFDHDPGAPAKSLDAFDKLPLPERLSHMLRQQPLDQGHFLASLPLQQWQESGDWFKGEFVKLNERMIESRSKRRDISRQYEDSIAKRYDEVMNERSVYEKALRSMAFSGHNVIMEGTPRRKR